MKKHTQKVWLCAVVVLLTAGAGKAQQWSGNNTTTDDIGREGKVGIGTSSPSALLEVNRNSAFSGSSNLDYFQVNGTTLSGINGTNEQTFFIVAANGNTGIGMGTPDAPLTVQTHEYYSGSGDFGPTIFKLEDPDGNFVGGFTNNGTSSTPGGSFIIRAAGGSDIPSFIVWNNYTQQIPFAVLADGTIANGVDVSGNADFTPQAQVNIVRNDVHDYLLKMQSNGQTQDYFDVHKSGYVGIGAENSGSSTLQIISNSTNTGSVAAVSVLGGSTVPRYIYAANGSSPSSANVYLSVKSTGTGIGIDDLSLGSTLAVKGNAANGTNIDLFGTATSGWDNQIRFKNSSGTTRHVITDDLSSNNLVIHPGFGGGANGMVQIDGKLKIGDVNTPNDYRLYVADGIMTEKVKVAVKTTNDWSDFVFDKNYKLRTFSELENYLAANQHLPGVPSTDDVMCNGIDVGKMDATLLQKVEELTLYVLQLKKENEKQQQEIEGLVKERCKN
jgi:hypothetical protein